MKPISAWSTLKVMSSESRMGNIAPSTKRPASFFLLYDSIERHRLVLHIPAAFDQSITEHRSVITDTGHAQPRCLKHRLRRKQPGGIERSRGISAKHNLIDTKRFKKIIETENYANQGSEAMSHRRKPCRLFHELVMTVHIHSVNSDVAAPLHGDFGRIHNPCGIIESQRPRQKVHPSRQQPVVLT